MNKRFVVRMYGEQFVVECNTDQDAIDFMAHCQKQWIDYMQTIAHEDLATISFKEWIKYPLTCIAESPIVTSTERNTQRSNTP